MSIENTTSHWIHTPTHYLNGIDNLARHILLISVDFDVILYQEASQLPCAVKYENLDTQPVKYWC